MFRMHAFRDLKPYVCTFNSSKCKTELFEDRNSWFEHELQHHRSKHTCSLCQQGPFTSKSDIISHIVSAHGSFSQDQLSAILASGIQVSTRLDASDCPFCDDWADTLQHRNPNSKLVSGQAGGSLVSLTRFKRHVATHQEQLALFAVPRHIEEAGSDRSGAGSISILTGSAGALDIADLPNLSDVPPYPSSGSEDKEQGQHDDTDAVETPRTTDNISNMLMQQQQQPGQGQQQQQPNIQPQQQTFQQQLQRLTQSIYTKMMHDVAAKFGGVENIPQDIMEKIRQQSHIRAQMTMQNVMRRAQQQQLTMQQQQQARVERLAGVVGEGGDDAAVGLAVAAHVNAARGRGRVMGVDEVEVLGEAAPARVADGVGPGGDGGEVVGAGVAQELLEVRGGGVGDEAAGEVGVESRSPMSRRSGSWRCVRDAPFPAPL